MPYLTGPNRNHTHLDAYNLFTNKVIKAAIYNNSYNSNDLDTISRAILGEEGGKYSGLSGPIFEQLTDLDEKRMYVFKDAELLLKCVANNNYELLKVMHSLSELTGIPFNSICNARGVTKIWTPVLDKLVEAKLNLLDGINGSDNEVIQYSVLSDYYVRKGGFTVGQDLEIELPTKSNVRYIGGWVMSPIPGEYKNVSVFDVTSLYPAMIVNNNISFETVNCQCCRLQQKFKVPKYLFEKKFQNRPHICGRNRGILTNQIENYMDKRIQFKRKSKEIRDSDPIKAREFEIISNSYKILINSVYGQMGHKFAKYENVQAAELVTRFGRYTIQKCAEIAEKLGWNIIYGDTDSLMIDSQITHKEIERFISECKACVNINMELDKKYDKFLISGAKNYVGISGSKLVVKGLAGKKSDRCLWVRSCFKQMLEDYREGINPCIKLRSEIARLQSQKLDNNLLIISKQLNKGIADYKINVAQKILGTKNNLEEGDTVRYFLADCTLKYTEDATKINFDEYKKQLINTVKPILKLLHYDVKKELDATDNINNNKLTEETEGFLINEKNKLTSLKDKPKNTSLKTRSAGKLIQLK